MIKKKKPFITLLGDSRDPPTFTGNDTAATLGGDGKPMRTYHSPTVAINSHYFVAINIRFEVTYPSTPCLSVSYYLFFLVHETVP